MQGTVRTWLVVASASAVALIDIALLLAFLRPWVRRAWRAGGVGARIAVSVVGVLQLLLLAVCALLIAFVFVPFGGACCL